MLTGAGESSGCTSENKHRKNVHFSFQNTNCGITTFSLPLLCSAFISQDRPAIFSALQAPDLAPTTHKGRSMSAAQVPQISMNDLCSFSEAPTQRDSLQHLRDCSLSTHAHQFKNSWIPAFASKSRASKRHGLDHIFRSLAGLIPSKHHLPKKLMLGENFLNVSTEKNQWDGGKAGKSPQAGCCFCCDRSVPVYLQPAEGCVQHMQRKHRWSNRETFLTQNSDKVPMTPRRSMMWHCSVQHCLLCKGRKSINRH